MPAWPRQGCPGTRRHLPYTRGKPRTQDDERMYFLLGRMGCTCDVVIPLFLSFSSLSSYLFPSPPTPHLSAFILLSLLPAYGRLFSDSGRKIIRACFLYTLEGQLSLGRLCCWMVVSLCLFFFSRADLEPPPRSPLSWEGRKGGLSADTPLFCCFVLFTFLLFGDLALAFLYSFLVSTSSRSYIPRHMTNRIRSAKRRRTEFT